MSVAQAQKPSDFAKNIATLSLRLLLCNSRNRRTAIYCAAEVAQVPGLIIVAAAAVAAHDGHLPSEAVGVCRQPASFGGVAEAALEGMLIAVGEVDGGAEVVFALAGAGYHLLILAASGDGAIVEAGLVADIAVGADYLDVQPLHGGGVAHIAEGCRCFVAKVELVSIVAKLDWKLNKVGWAKCAGKGGQPVGIFTADGEIGTVVAVAADDCWKDDVAAGRVVGVKVLLWGVGVGGCGGAAIVASAEDF